MEYSFLVNGLWDKPRGKNNLILHFNFFLDRKANYFSLNESSLEGLWDRLDNLVIAMDVSYWLTLARIHELALLSAENYANNGELTLVGDLLFNPRLILVHINGQKRPIIKKRHSSLTEQFRGVPDVVQWLKKETSLETKIEALIPYLHQKMESSGYFCQDYFDLMKERKKKIVELTLFLAAAGVSDSDGFYYWLEKAGPQDREMVQARICRCNLNYYSELGRLAKEFAQGSSTPIGFKKMKAIPVTPKRSYHGESGLSPM